MNLAEKLQQLIVLHNKTVTNVINNTNINQSTMSRILSGNTVKPKQSTLQELANYFKIPVDELQINKDNTNNNILALKKNNCYLLANNLLQLSKQYF